MTGQVNHQALTQLSIHFTEDIERNPPSHKKPQQLKEAALKASQKNSLVMSMGCNGFQYFWSGLY